MFWNSFQNIFDDDFHDAIDTLIANHRTAPMLEHISKAVEEARVRRNTNHIRDGYATSGAFTGVLQDAARKNKSADPDFVKACIKLLNDKYSGKLSHKQFLEGCDYLDEVAQQLSR